MGFCLRKRKDFIYEILKEYDLTIYQKYAIVNTNIERYVKCMVDLYGLVSFEDIICTYNKQFGIFNELNDDYLQNYLRVFHSFDIQIKTRKKRKCACHYWLHSADDIRYIEERHQSIKRKQFRFKELCQFKDDRMYVRNDKVWKDLYLYLSSELNPLSVKEFMSKAIFLAKAGFIMQDIDDLVDDLIKRGFSISEDDLVGLIGLLINLHNNTIHWETNGYSPNELKSFETR